METISEIFLATDFAVHSQKAEQKAMFMAKKLHLPLNIIYVLDNNVLPSKLYENVMDKHPEWLKEIHDEMRQNSKLLISKLFKELEASGQKYIIEGKPKEALVEFIQKQNVELLVMGKRGNKKSSYVGSVSEYVTRHADCSVLLVS